MRRVGNALTRRKGVGVFWSALLRREGVRGFGFGIGCSGVIQMTRDGRRQVGVGRIGVGTVTVMTFALNSNLGFALIQAQRMEWHAERHLLQTRQKRVKIEKDFYDSIDSESG